MPLNTTTAASTNLNTPLNGTASNDTLNGGAADDTLNGLAGNDQLFGFAGNDILEGGTGNDFMNGGLGNDSYLFGRGDGRDIVYMTDVRPMTEVNTLRLKEGVLPSDLAFDMVGTSLLINIIGGSDQFRADGFFYGTNTTNSANPLQQIVFADGTTWNLAEIQARLYAGTEGADVRGGTYLADAIAGLAGNDLLDGKGGNDIIDGGADADSLIGGLGDDTLLGGTGEDQLDGGGGNDKLNGGAGDDTFLFGKGDGKDTITVFGGGGIDTLQLKAGILPADVLVEASPESALLIRFLNSTDQLTVDQFMPGPPHSPQINALRQIRFADGTFWDSSAIMARLRAGTDGDNRITGTDAAELFTGQGGDDVLVGAGGDDTLDGGSGKDVLAGGSGNDIYLFGRDDGQDTIGHATDAGAARFGTLRFKPGILPADVVLGSAEIRHSMSSNDLLIKIRGSDAQVRIERFTRLDASVDDRNPVQQIQFEDGTTWNVAAIEAALLAGSEQDDMLSGTLNSERIGGRGGNDYLDGQGGDDTLDGGAGDDILSGGAGKDTYLFGAGDGNDTIRIEARPLSGEHDTLELKAGIRPEDVALSLDHGLLLRLKNTNEQIVVPDFHIQYNDEPFHPLTLIRFADGTAWNTDVIETHAFKGTEGNNYYVGNQNANLMHGLGGDDTLDGGGGNDTLDGGTGNDTLDGEKGSDTYLFGKGDGQDRIDFSYSDAADLDTLQFKEGISPSDITLRVRSGSLFVTIKDSTDQIEIYDYAAIIDYSPDMANPLRQFRFADGSTWSLAQIEERRFRGTEDADTFYGTAQANFIAGLGGDDTLVASGGDDTLDGGAGNDSIKGGTGSDTYLFGRGDGVDRVYYEAEILPAKSDTLQFKEGVLARDVALSASGSNLIASIRGTSDSVQIDRVLAATGSVAAASPLQLIRFADGTIWTRDDIEAQLLQGTAAPDTLTGNAKANVLNGFGGADRLDGQGGDDTLDGGTGNDTLQGGTGSDTYLFGKGDGQDTIAAIADTQAGKIDTLAFKASVLSGDVTLRSSGAALVIQFKDGTDRLTVHGFTESPLSLSNPLQQIVFSDGTTWNVAQIRAQLYTGSDSPDSLSGSIDNDKLAGHGGADTLSGGDGDDTLDGGTGNDVLQGGLGNDTYHFNKGDGQDTIAYINGDAQDRINTLAFGPGVTASEVSMKRAGADLLIKLAGDTDRITVQNFLLYDSPHNSTNPLQRIVFADGTSWNLAMLTDKLYAGTELADGLVGTSGGDVIRALGGDDRIDARAGNDTLDGGSGNDSIDGGTGSDTYLFGRGDGQDTIVSVLDTAVGKSDTLQFKAGILPGEISLSRGTTSLIVRINNSSDQLTFDNFLANDRVSTRVNPLQQIRFHDGTIWDQASLALKMYTGDDADNTIIGGQLADAISGFGGADRLIGGGGNDTIDGGSGDDSITGGLGGDTYLFGRGDGQDTLASTHDTAVGKIDTLQFREGVTGSDLRLSVSGDPIKNATGESLIVNIGGTDDQITVHQFFTAMSQAPGPFSPLQQIRFADGSSWGLAAIQAELAADMTAPVSIGLVGVGTASA